MLKSYNNYRLAYLRTTHRQSFVAWSGGLVLSALVDLMLHLLVCPLPLAKLGIVRLAGLGFLYFVYRQRLQSSDRHQILWVAVNFFGFAFLVAWIASIVDPILQVPVYVSAGFAVVGATALYPSQMPLAALFPVTVSIFFSMTYLGFAGLENEGVYVLAMLLATSPFLSSFGSVRLDNALKEAFNLNRKLVKEIEMTETAQRRLSATLKNVSDAVIALDPEGRIEFANPEADKLLGVRDTNHLEMKLLEVVDFVTRSDERLQPDLGMVWSSPHDTFLRTHQGKIPVGVIGLPMKDEAGNLTGNVFTIRDLSQMREQEERRVVQARLEALGVLAGGLAHEFNNVLTAVQGNISLAEAELEQDNTARGSLLDANVALEKARKLANRLVTFSKGGTPHRERLFLASLLEETVGLCLKGTSVTAELDLDEELVANVDPLQMGQVFQNIVINAVEAMPDGGRLKVNMKGSGKDIVILFEDEGPGIPGEVADKAFDPYFSTKQGGTGLGLTTAYYIARKHDGLLSLLDSQNGARIQLTIPLVEEQARVESAEPATGSSARRALVMDDELKVRKITCRMLEHLGFQAVSTEEGASALEEYRRGFEAGTPYSLVMVDLMVPEGMGGKELIPKLLDFDPGARIVVASGYSDDAIVSGWRNHGLAGALPKPYGLAHLKALLSQLNLIEPDGDSGQ